jgi:hypothetical protein
MEDVALELPFLEHGWFTHLCGHLLALDRAIWIEHAWVPQPQCEGDKSLMEAFTCPPGIKKVISSRPMLSDTTYESSPYPTSPTWVGDASCKNASGTWQADSNLRWPESHYHPNLPLNYFECRNDRDIPLETERHVLEPA